MRIEKNTPRRHTAWRRFRISRVGVTVALVVFLALGSTGAYAYWNATTSMAFSKSVDSGSLAINVEWAPAVEKKFDNRGFDSSLNNWIETRSFTVTNNTLHTTKSLPYTVKLSATGAVPDPNSLTTKLKVEVWPMVTNCSSGTPTLTTTWSANSVVSGALSPGASKVYCVKTSVTERSDLADSNGSVTIVPTLTAQLTAGDNWVAEKVATGTKQKTSYIYPAFTPSTPWYNIKTSVVNFNCLDVEASGSGGTNVIAYPCNTPMTANQVVRFTPSTNGYVKISFGHDPAILTGLDGGSTSTNAQAKVQGGSPVTDDSQDWQFQQKRAGVYQIVNRKSGLCLQPDISTIPGIVVVRQQTCSGAAIQEYTLDSRAENPWLSGLTCTNVGANGSNGTFKLDWDNQLQGPVTVQVREQTSANNYGGWTYNGAPTSPAKTYPIVSSPTLRGWNLNSGYRHEFRIINSAGIPIAVGKFTVVRSGNWWDPYAYDLRCAS